MTTVISRLYDGPGTAGAAALQLMEAGFPADIIDVINAGKSAEHAMIDGRVHAKTAATYASHLTDQRSVLIVRAPFMPVGAALKAMEVADAHGPIDAGVENENVYLTETPSRTHFLNVMTDHPRFMTSDLVPGSGRYRSRASTAFGLRLLSQKKRRNSVYSGGKLMMSKKLTSKPRKLSISRGGTIFSNALHMAPLLAHNRG